MIRNFLFTKKNIFLQFLLIGGIILAIFGIMSHRSYSTSIDHLEFGKENLKEGLYVDVNATKCLTNKETDEDGEKKALFSEKILLFKDYFIFTYQMKDGNYIQAYVYKKNTIENFYSLGRGEISSVSFRGKLKKTTEDVSGDLSSVMANFDRNKFISTYYIQEETGALYIGESFVGIFVTIMSLCLIALEINEYILLKKRIKEKDDEYEEMIKENPKANPVDLFSYADDLNFKNKDEDY